jgi:hypothetical protein
MNSSTSSGCRVVLASSACSVNGYSGAIVVSYSVLEHSGSVHSVYSAVCTDL